MSTASPVEIRDTAFDHPDSEKLRAAQRIEIDARYGGDTEPGTKPSASDVPVFVVAYDAAGRPVPAAACDSSTTPQPRSSACS